MAYSYQRRNELARDKGFASYSEYRRVTELASSSQDFTYHVGQLGGPRALNLDMANLYYQAFGKGSKDDYSIHTRRGKAVVLPDGRGARAKWLIDVAGYVDDADEWKRRYPTGRRE